MPILNLVNTPTNIRGKKKHLEPKTYAGATSYTCFQPPITELSYIGLLLKY